MLYLKLGHFDDAGALFSLISQSACFAAGAEAVVWAVCEQPARAAHTTPMTTIFFTGDLLNSCLNRPSAGGRMFAITNVEALSFRDQY